MRVLDLFAGTGSGTQAWEDRGHEVRSVELDDRFDGVTDRADVLLFQRRPSLWLGDWSPDVVHASPPCFAFTMAGKGSKAAWDRYKAGEVREGDSPLSEFRWHYDQDHAFFGPRVPNDQRAVLGCKLVLAALECVRKLEPTFWWLENPMGGLRTLRFMQVLSGEESVPAGFVEDSPVYAGRRLCEWIVGVDAGRRDVTYCQYWNPRLDVEPVPRMKRTDLWGVFPEGWEPRPVCGNGEPCHASAPRGSDTGTQELDPVDRARIPYELGSERARATEIALGVTPVDAVGGEE